MIAQMTDLCKLQDIAIAKAEPNETPFLTTLVDTEYLSLLTISLPNKRYVYCHF